MIRAFFRWLLSLFVRKPRIRDDRFRAILVDDVPEVLQESILYVVGELDPWAVAMLCPCGCGSIIHLSLLRSERPNWSLDFSPDGVPSLYPSVWRTTGCKSHFFLKQGVVVWCKASDLGIR